MNLLWNSRKLIKELESLNKKLSRKRNTFLFDVLIITDPHYGIE